MDLAPSGANYATLQTLDRAKGRLICEEPDNVRLRTYRRKDGALVSVESYRPKRHQNQPNQFIKPV